MSAVLERSKHVPPDRVIASDPAVLQRVAQAIEQVYEGIPLIDALKALNLTRSMFTGAISGQRELALSYARAREVSADFLVDEALRVVQTEENQMKARNIADMHRWAAGKFNSKRYGDRIDLNVTQTLDIAGTLLEARQRMLRPMRDQLDVMDAQVPMNTGVLALGASDSQSQEPDIFAAPAPVEVAADPSSDVPDIFS